MIRSYDAGDCQRRRGSVFLSKREEFAAERGVSGVMKVVCTNRKARHDYTIIETVEAGIVLTGTEVKSLRAGGAHLKDSYASIENGELFLFASHISPYKQGNRFNHEPERTRKLLMHAKEIRRLVGKTREKGLTLIPLKLKQPILITSIYIKYKYL